MSYCKVCGDETTARYRLGARQTLCDGCGKDTPRKATRESFDAFYWNGDSETPPESTKQDFYEDYLRSANTLKEYRKATTSTL